MRKVSTKASIYVPLLTLFCSVLLVTSGFEENYCWDKGDIAAGRNGNAMITATKEDAKALKGFDVTEGQQIGKSFRTHMLCHQTFNLTQAIQESYFSKK
jgi:hypothetical protein